MKDFLSSIIKKAKNFVADLTPTAKIKYIVIAALTVTIATSLLVAVSLNTSEPEAPTNPEDFATGETATIDFDNEMIFDVSGTSSDSAAIEGTESSSETPDDSSDMTTDDDTSSKETSAEPDESTSEDEPQPTDPSQTNNDDPEPVITTPVHITNDPQTDPKPTESTTKTPQTEPKPTETTTKTPQTEPKPTETTTKTPQTDPKPTETTTKAPQTEPKPTETQPQEDPPQQSGQFSVKEKKYDYNGANVTILQVQNKSQQAYTITITGKFKDANGNIVKTESKTFEGFPAEWSNYFVFQPGIKYSSASWDMDADEFAGKTVADSFEFSGNAYCQPKTSSVDKNGNRVFIITPEVMATLKKVIVVDINFGPIKNKQTSPIHIVSDTVLFDSNGEICHIGSTSRAGFINEDFSIYLTVPYFSTDLPWSEINNYKLPDHLNSTSGILALTSVTE